MQALFEVGEMTPTAKPAMSITIYRMKIFAGAMLKKNKLAAVTPLPMIKGQRYPHCMMYMLVIKEAAITPIDLGKRSSPQSEALI